ncbi:MAG TPA: redoxin domain-containing protein [Acidimicrobiales bacterium]|nr:redoxin domain-containing protein [Acidimicrobiales bacterium]
MIGTEAPDFTRKATTGEEVTLSALRGSPVVLVFYPFTFTGVCEGELCSIRDDRSSFVPEGAAVVAISCDPGPSQKAWADQQGWTFPVVSDFWPHGEIARAYGAFNEERGCANRVTVVIGADGVVVDWFDTPALGEARSPERYAEALGKL